MAAVSWLVHKSHEPSWAADDPPLVLSPLPAHLYFSLFLYPCLFSCYLLRLSLRLTSLAHKLPRALLLAHSRLSLPRPLTGTTSYVSLSLSFRTNLNLFLDSHIKPTLMTASAAANTVTIAVIQRPRTNSHSARPLFSTRSKVSGEACPLCSPPEAAARARTPHVPRGPISRESNIPSLISRDHQTSVFGRHLMASPPLVRPSMRPLRGVPDLATALVSSPLAPSRVSSL